MADPNDWVTVDDEPEGGAMGGGGSDSAPSKPLLAPKDVALDARAVEVRERKRAAEQEYRKFQLGNAMSGGQLAADLAKRDPAAFKRFQEYGDTGAMAEALSILSGAPLIGSLLDEATGAVKSRAVSGPKYEAERNKAKAVIDAAQSHSPAGPVIGSFALPLPKTPVGRIAFGGAQGALQGAGDAESLPAVPGAMLREGLKGATSNALSEGIAKGGAGLEQTMRSGAEGQALKAAGLRGGITNQVQKKLGLPDEEAARALGRDFLDEDLIPFAGTKADVAKRAEKLEGMAGQTIGGVLNEADVATMRTPGGASGATVNLRGAPQPGFDYKAFGDAARQTIDDASAVADDMSGQKARQLSDALAAQGKRTPGSFVGANKAKSDAWKSARFDDDAPMSAQLYRNAVGAARDNLEQQVARALGPEKANALNNANRKYGVAADALKLANNAGTRDMSNRAMGLGLDTMMTSGGAALGQQLLGPIGAVPGGAAGLALSKTLGARGNAAAARTLDALSAPVGKTANALGRGVRALEPATASTVTSDDPLAPYLDLLEEEQKP